MEDALVIFWFRRDLRLEDNAGLYEALTAGFPVLPIFIFDTNILNQLENRKDLRVQFIHNRLVQLTRRLESLGSTLRVFYGTPFESFSQIIRELPNLKSVFTNNDYEPYARIRDEEIKKLLTERGVDFRTVKDHVIFEKEEVMKEDGTPYTVFTPYRNKWMAKINDFHTKTHRSKEHLQNLKKTPPMHFPSLKELNFRQAEGGIPEMEINRRVIKEYHETRDFPAINGTSKLSIHLRFGTLSIRELVRVAQELSVTWLNELIWREFYQMILWHFPDSVHRAFKAQYNKIPWRNNETEFLAWCNGETGYPIVDAGMRELNSTGYMHNRVRMIVASFLTKHLLIDWRWGERYFAEKLIDFELASNVGGWQWAAGSGCDAAPYFRVFNPELQTKKFDPNQEYIRKWVPEYQELTYPRPVVEHNFARQRAIETYKKALNQ